jgi:hypothetical protein
MKKCPFKSHIGLGGGKCSEDCALYREETRIDDVTGKAEHLKGCCLSMMADHLINLNRRTGMMQAELGQNKNATVYLAMATLVEKSEAKQELFKVIKKHFTKPTMLK